MAGLEQRIDRLEQRMQGKDQGPGYVSVEDLDELAGLHLTRPVKVYLGGVSPDDWPGPTKERGAP